MVFVSQRIIPLLIVLIIQVFNEFSSGSRMKPILNVNESQRIINEGETIELECTGDEGVVFHYPKNYHKTSVLHLNTIPKKSNDQKHHIKLFLNSTTFQDTGYYGCAYDGAEFKENIYNSSEASWIYIYVRSNGSLFVQTKNKKTSGYMNEKTVIPCRPTSPNYNVTLLYEDSEFSNSVYKEVQRNDKITFDPKYGFEIKDVSMKDERRYQCKFVDEEKKSLQTCTFDLLVYDPPRFTITHAPEIAIEAQKLNLECKIHALGTHPDLQLRWIFPNGDVYQNLTSNENRITSNTEVFNAPSEIDVTSFLTIQNLTLSDNGKYTCALLSNGYLFSNRIYLKVHNSITEPINVTRLSEEIVLSYCGHTVELVAEIDMYPDIDIGMETRWWYEKPFMNPKELASGDRHEVKRDRLIIRNIKTSDMGTYVLRISNGANITATFGFVLYVLCKKN